MEEIMIYSKVRDIRNEFMFLHSRGKFNTRGMVELQGVSFIADEDTIFGTVNNAYIDKEFEWYLSMSRNVYDMKNPPKIWKDIATPDGYINSNYGYLVYHKDNNSQFQKVIRTLRRRPDSKQATMIYTRPEIHQQAFDGGRRDFICTNVVNYNQDSLNPDVINAIVQMRSCDAIFGYKNDLPWQQYVLNEVCAAVGKRPGIIIWQCSSLHIYPRHFDLINNLFTKSK